MKRFFLTCAFMVAAIALTGTTVPAAAQSEAADYFRIGAQEMASGYPDRAIMSLEKGVQLKPESKEGWYNLGVAYGAVRQHQKEVNAYLKALELDPNYANALHNLGLAYLDLGKKDEAIDSLQKVLKIDPAATDGWNNLSIAMMAAARFDEALEAAARAVETAPKAAEIRFNHALAFFKKAESLASTAEREPFLKQALATYDQVLELDPMFFQAHYNKAVIHHMMGQSASEIAEYRLALQARPDYTPALYNLAAALSATEDLNAAIEAWEKYVASSRNKSDEKPFVENARKEIARLRGL